MMLPPLAYFGELSLTNVEFVQHKKQLSSEETSCIFIEVHAQNPCLGYSFHNNRWLTHYIVHTISVQESSLKVHENMY